MGTVKLMNMKEAQGSNPALHLKNSLEYILNVDKTEKRRYVGGNVGDDPNEIFKDMVEVKEFYNKTTNKNNNRRQGYHFVFTFPPGEATEEECFEMTQELCEELFGDDYQHVFAVHNDKAHMHSHIVFNSVALDGHMYDYKNGDWGKYIQKKANEIAKKHGKSEINLKSDNPNKGKEKWQKEDKYFNRYELIRQDIDKAIALSDSYEDFINILKDNEYDLRFGKSENYGEYISFSPLWDNRATRSFRLGSGYTVQGIKQRILNKEQDKVISETLNKMNKTKMKHKDLFVKWNEQPQIVRDQYRKNIELMREWSNNTFKPFPDSYKIKQQMLHLKDVQREYQYLCNHKDVTENMESVKTRLDYVQSEIDRLRKQRTGLYYKKKTDNSVKINIDIKDLSNQIKTFGKEKEILLNIYDDRFKTTSSGDKIKEIDNKDLIM